MYPHHILTRDDNETIKKIYLKQTENHVKEDWFQLLSKDFEFIERDINEKEISEMSKDLMNKAVLKFVMNIQQTQSTLDGVQYSRKETQPYLTIGKLKTKKNFFLI